MSHLRERAQECVNPGTFLSLDDLWVNVQSRRDRQKHRTHAQKAHKDGRTIHMLCAEDGYPIDWIPAMNDAVAAQMQRTNWRVEGAHFAVNVALTRDQQATAPLIPSERFCIATDSGYSSWPWISYAISRNLHVVAMLKDDLKSRVYPECMKTVTRDVKNIIGKKPKNDDKTDDGESDNEHKNDGDDEAMHDNTDDDDTDDDDDKDEENQEPTELEEALRDFIGYDPYDPCPDDDEVSDDDDYDPLAKHPIGRIARFWGEYWYCVDRNGCLVLTFCEKYVVLPNALNIFLQLPLYAPGTSRPSSRLSKTDALCA